MNILHQVLEKGRRARVAVRLYTVLLVQVSSLRLPVLKSPLHLKSLVARSKRVIAWFRQSHITIVLEAHRVMGNELDYRARIADIAGRTGWYRVFGAGYQGHDFGLTLHSRDEIALFEEQLGVRLPNEYAALLMETGSGAGPYYGLWTPGRNLGRS